MGILWVLMGIPIFCFNEQISAIEHANPINISILTIFTILGRRSPMKKPMPFDFLLDYLPAGIIVKPAIGMFYIYFDKKIILIFRETRKNPQHNGIWISTQREHHASLKAEIPAITHFELEEGFDTAWLLLNDKHEDFEGAAIQLCKLVTGKDHRIGKITPASTALFQ